MARRGQANAPVGGGVYKSDTDRLAELLLDCTKARATYPKGHRERVEIDRQIERLKNERLKNV